MMFGSRITRTINTIVIALCVAGLAACNSESEKARDKTTAKKNRKTTQRQKSPIAKKTFPKKTDPVEKTTSVSVPAKTLGPIENPPKDDDPPSTPRINRFAPKRMPIDDARVASKGIRKLEGKHLTLYTDLPASQDVDELPKVFDLAVPQWCAYFKIDPAEVADWRMTGFVMKEPERFRAAGVFPDKLPPFEYGYQRGWEFWLYEQLTDEGEPAKYYRRHLFLHEGTHGFMNWHLGGCGALWYMEGMAELFGTHKWQDGKLTMNYTPRNKEEVPYWGRVKLIKAAVAEGRGLSLIKVLHVSTQGRQLRAEVYAWSWAATTFFDKHPDYREAFDYLPEDAADNTELFTRILTDELKKEWIEVNEQWQLFVMDMEYGYDVARAAVKYAPGKPLAADGATADVAVDRGWQSTGIALSAGQTYEITAAGRYQIGDQPKIWWCEPGGITIHYHQGRPLGMLVATIRNDEEPLAGGSPLVRPQPIGLGREIAPTTSGTLYLKINESPAALADNKGKLTVQITPK